MISSLIHLDKRKNLPLRDQLLISLRSILLNRNLRNDTHLPSPKDLAKDLGVTEAMVQSVYEDLMHQAILEQDADHYKLKTQLITTYHRVLSSIVDAIEAYGMKAKVHTLYKGPLHQSNSRLKLDPSQTYLFIRAFSANDMVVGYENSQLSLVHFHKLETLDFASGLLYKTLFKAHPDRYHITRTIRAEGLPKDIADAMKQPAKVPAYCIHQTITNGQGQVVESAENWVIADYFHFFTFDVDLKTRT